jgi:hypothetical protein
VAGRADNTSEEFETFHFSSSGIIPQVRTCSGVLDTLLAPYLILLAQYQAAAAGAISRANGERLVLASGSPINHSPTRRKLKEVAPRRWCRWVLVSPMYLEQRTSQVRTVRETVTSIPARLAYCALNSAVSSRSRALCRTSWCSLGLLMEMVLLFWHVKRF